MYTYDVMLPILRQKGVERERETWEKRKQRKGQKAGHWRVRYWISLAITEVSHIYVLELTLSSKKTIIALYMDNFVSIIAFVARPPFRKQSPPTADRRPQDRRLSHWAARPQFPQLAQKLAQKEAKQGWSYIGPDTKVRTRLPGATASYEHQIWASCNILS